MDLTELVGRVAFVVTVLFASFGMMAQVLKNYKAKSTAGLSVFTFFMQFMCFLLWSTYGYLKQDFNLIGANIPGCFFVSFILLQFFLYRNKLPHKKTPSI